MNSTADFQSQHTPLIGGVDLAVSTVGLEKFEN